MQAVDFPQSNFTFGPPEGMDESQVHSIRVYVDQSQRGNLDGSHFVVVAWQPTDLDRERIAAGDPVFISMLGGLAPHFLTTRFEEAAI